MNLIELLVEKGWTVKSSPDRVLFHRFQDHRGKGEWELFANGNSEVRTIYPTGWDDMELPPFHFAVFWNGWLAGLLCPDPRDGTLHGVIAAHPDGPNQDDFLLSLKGVPPST